MKNQTNVDPYVKWNNTVIRIENEFHGAKVIEFWESVGVNTFGWKDNAMDIPYYGICNGIFDNYIDSSDCRVLTLEEAIAIRDSEIKTFPREMYCWNNDSSNVIKRNVVFIAKDHCIKYNIMSYNNGVWASYQHAMEVEEYEKLYLKQQTKRLPTMEEVIKWFEEDKIFYYSFDNILARIESINTWKKSIVINNTILSIENFCKRYTYQNGNELYITE